MITYKKLIVSGCSYTNSGYPTWAYFLSEKYNLELVNLAWSGAGNKHIADSLILYLEQNKCDANEVLIGAMWSGIDRHDWYVSLPDPKYAQYHRYHYTNNVFLIFPQQILHDLKLTRDLSRRDPDFVLDLAYFRGREARQLDGLMSMIYLNSYLAANGYTFFQTHFFDPNGDEGQSGYMRGSRYADASSKFRISCTRPGMLNFAHDQFLGNWALDQNLHHSAYDYHPTPNGHKLWTETVLIPQMIQQKLLTSG